MTTHSSLVSAEWLSQNRSNPDLVVLDATIPKVGQAELSEEARTRQIVGSRFFDLKNRFRDLDAELPNTMPSPEQFSREARALGINSASSVVVYDHHGIYSSPRAWWAFRVMGHTNVAVLDGGFAAWKDAGLPTEEKVDYVGPAGDFAADLQRDLLTDSKSVLTSLGQENVAILDARSEGRFLGTAPEPRASLRSGHIPGSQNLPTARILDNGSMLPIEQLRNVFAELQLENKKLVLSCGSGITACVLALGAELAGYGDKAVFDGSWTEWGEGDKFPVEK